MTDILENGFKSAEPKIITVVHYGRWIGYGFLRPVINHQIKKSSLIGSSFFERHIKLLFKQSLAMHTTDRIVVFWISNKSQAASEHF